MNTYNLKQPPAYVRAIGGDGCAAEVKWSNDSAPPAIGETVLVRINGIGPAKVSGYFVEAGWLGLHVDPVSPPEWYVKQNGLGAPCHVFGAEIGAVTAAERPWGSHPSKTLRESPVNVATMNKGPQS